VDFGGFHQEKPEKPWENDGKMVIFWKSHGKTMGK